jgi:hypothetical protein
VAVRVDEGRAPNCEDRVANVLVGDTATLADGLRHQGQEHVEEAHELPRLHALSQPHEAFEIEERDRSDLTNPVVELVGRPAQPIDDPGIEVLAEEALELAPAMLGRDVAENNYDPNRGP